MSKPASTTVQSKPSPNTPLPTKSAWARGPPVNTASAASPISRSHSPNGSTTPINTPTHSRKPSGLGPGTSAIPLKDGVTASRGIVGSGHRASPSLSFGSIESNPSATPARIPSNGVNGQPPADTSRPPSKAAANPPATMTLPTPLPTPAQPLKSLNSPAPTPPVSSTSSPTPSSVSASASSAPSALPAKKKLDPHKMFQVTPQASPAAVPPSSSINNPPAPAVASPQQRTSNLPPPAQHQHTPYYSQQSQLPHLRSQSQSAVPRSPQLARAYPNGNLTPGPNPAPLPNRVQPGPPIPSNGPGIGSPRLGHQPPPLHQAPPQHHPTHQPPASQPPQLPMHMQQQWGPYYFYNEYGQVPGAPYWPQHHYPPHLPAPQHPQHPQHSGPIPISPRVPSMSNLPPVAPPINTSVPTPPPTNSRIPSTPLTAQAREFVPGQMGQIAPKKPTAIRITNPQGDPVVLKPDANKDKEDVVVSKQENRKSKGITVRLESEEDRNRRLDEAKAKERAEEEERKRLQAEAEAKQRVQREKEEEAKRKAEEERIRREEEVAAEARRVKEAEEAEQRRKEEELRLKLEEEERVRREEEERIKREEEERIKREEEERLRLVEEENRKREEEEARLRKLKEEEEQRIKAEIEEAERVKREAEERARKEEEDRVRREEEEAAAKEEAKRKAAAAVAASPKPGPSSLPPKPTLPPLVTTADGKPRRPIPGPLDLSSTNRGSISQPLPSALKTARPIEDLDSVSYPEGIKTPDCNLNVGATKDGKFKYDRDFLLQFMSVCKDKPDMLPPLDVLGIEREDGATTGFMSRSTSRRGPGAMAPPPNRQPSSSLSSFGKNPFAASMGNFQTPSRMSGEDRFNSNRRESTGAQFAPNAIRALPMSRSSSQGGVGGINAVPPSPRGETNRTRSQRGRQRNESLKASASTPFQSAPQGFSNMGQMEPIAPLEASANRWVANSTSRAARTKAEEDSAEIVERKVKSLLNKLTLEKFDSISNQIIEWANKSEKENDGRTLMQVIKLVFEKATDEATWSEMYAKLCRKMMEQISPQVKDEGIRNAEGQPITGGLLFRKYLLNRCQEDFERGWKAKETAVAAAATKAEGDKAIEEAQALSGNKDDEVALYSDEYYVLLKLKRQGLGLVKFIGELFKLQMLTERIMHECIKKLLSNVENPEEEDIESLCRLLITVGQALDTQKARGHMDIYFTRMNDLAQNKSVSQRMQFMLLDVIELRRRSWIPRTAAAAPQTIAQVHEAAAKEKAAAEKEAMSRIGREPMSRGGSRRGEHTRGGDFPPSVDGWNVAGSGGPPRPVGKAGDLSHFGKINKSSVSTFGPSSVFSSKRDGKGKDTPPGSLSRAASSSNMFSMLSSGDASLEPPPAPRTTSSSRPSSRKTSLDLTNSGVPDTPIRKKLNLLPRSIPANSLEEEARTESEGEADGEGSTVVAALSDEQANAKIDQDIKEFFMLKDVSEAEKYFADLPDPHKPKLVEKLVTRAFEGKEADIKMVAELFSRVADKTCPALAFEQGFFPTIEYIEDMSIDVPQAYPFMALLLKGSKLSLDAVETLGAKINVEAEPLVAPKDKLLKEYNKLA